ncbi:hypothetical protein AXF42_Ash002129 [Apostasia shenzhenica]|uniref:Uncharacterized protein n=1 Tax=Apostasia shenzhenica TaxID=1088818 RepID=A0A2I0AMY5_9ASPA|nr:hypothetical protein AXF42_Ash002129 [Apostasia shenzhenica]
MDKLLDFGKRAWFLVRVLSGYEERRIRSFRLQLQKRIEEARARKMELRRAPEQAILAEVRRMVEEMQTLNRRLDKTEAAIEDYFKPIDKKVEIIMNLQLEKEEKQLKEMIEVMQEQAALQKPLQLNQSESVVVCPSNSQPPESTSQQEQIKYEITNRHDEP